MDKHENPLTFTLSPGMAPAAPLMRLLASFDRSKVEAFAEISVALLDAMAGDAEAEPVTWPEDVNARDLRHLPDDSESGGDDKDIAWQEWHLRGPRKGCQPNLGLNEDDEDDDPGEEDDPSGDYASEDDPSGYRMAHWNRGAGCPISDPGGDEHDGREPDDGY